MASLILELSRRGKGQLARHRTVGDKYAAKRLHIYFSTESRQRFVLTEVRDERGGRQFTELKEVEPGKSLIAIEGECEKELGLNQD